MFFIDLFWITSGIFTLVSLFYRNKNESFLFNLLPFLLHVFLTLIILFTSIKGMFIGNLEFIYGVN